MPTLPQQAQALNDGAYSARLSSAFGWVIASFRCQFFGINDINILTKSTHNSTRARDRGLVAGSRVGRGIAGWFAIQNGLIIVRAYMRVPR